MFHYLFPPLSIGLGAIMVIMEGTYLFTGDTIMLGADGDWVAGHIPPISEAGPLAESLRLLGTLRPDLVISSAFPSEAAVHVPGGAQWVDCVAQARSRLAEVA